jgi:hypothetical protein
LGSIPSRQAFDGALNASTLGVIIDSGVEDHDPESYSIDGIDEIRNNLFGNGQFGQILISSNRCEIISVVSGPKGSVCLIASSVGGTLVMALVGEGCPRTTTSHVRD